MTCKWHSQIVGKSIIRSRVGEDQTIFYKNCSTYTQPQVTYVGNQHGQLYLYTKRKS